VTAVSAATGKPPADTAALQRLLAAEHAAVWGYGVIGGKLPPGQQPAALASDRAHRGRRDALTGLLLTRRVTPAASAASYHLPFPVDEAGAARRLAVHLERGVAATWYAGLAEVTGPALRRLALAALTDAATRGLQWRLTVPGEPSTVPFPGT